MYVCVYMSVCVCVCYVQMCVRVLLCVHTRVYMCMCVHAMCTHVNESSVYVCVHVSMYAEAQH